MAYRPPGLVEEKPTVTHLLDSWYEPEIIKKLKIEELKKKLMVMEDLKKNEITVTMGQWKDSRFGRIYRRESVKLTSSVEYFTPKSVIIYYGPFRDEKIENYMLKLLNKFVKKTNKSVGPDVVKIRRAPHGIAMGFEATGGWEGVICSIRELEQEIYGPDVSFELYGLD